jgi:hypothetical protein
MVCPRLRTGPVRDLKRLSVPEGREGEGIAVALEKAPVLDARRRRAASSVPLPSASCGGCGFEGDVFSPQGIVDALEEISRRWRECSSHFSGAELVGPYCDQGWTAAQHAEHVRDSLHAKVNRLVRMLEDDRPRLEETEWQAAGEPVPMAILVVELALCAERLARVIVGVRPEDWLREGVRAGHTVTARQVVLEATHEGFHHLDQLERSTGWSYASR